MKSCPSALMILATSLLAVTPVYAQKKPKSTTTTTTAQSIMADLQASGQFVIRGSETYEFDATEQGGGDKAPIEYYTNTATNSTATNQDGFITQDGVTVGYSIAGGAPANRPSDASILANLPSSPGPDPAQVVAQATDKQSKDYLTFTKVGTTAALGSRTYSRTKTWTGTSLTGASLRTVTYSWSFRVAPKPAESFAALTGWTLAGSSTDGLAKVNINGIVAGQSVLKKGDFTKYSFGLQSSVVTDLGVVTVSRVEGLEITATVAGYDPITLYPSHVIVSGNDIDDAGNVIGDFDYFANAGSFGTALASLAEGDARTILNTDGFAGNDDGGGDGSSLQHAVLQNSQFDLPAGEVTVTFKGTVKGNSGETSDQKFTVSKSISVDYVAP